MKKSLNPIFDEQPSNDFGLHRLNSPFTFFKRSFSKSLSDDGNGVHGFVSGTTEFPGSNGNVVVRHFEKKIQPPQEL